ncbi:unnamed protein product [Caenorhabditis auriculariae]|uniref:HECT domain-containing protein n=1 Tax=Caenorhabditis auriculariae TaxID=2777116 RepID=A0A8S1GTB5_9PELO|nr:unnamed protein product [Caenorhabditis auriculariae]
MASSSTSPHMGWLRMKKIKREILGCGLATDGQLGGRFSDSTVTLPEQIIAAPSDANGTSVRGVACGEKHTVFLADDGKMWSVGSNEDGQLGRGNRNQGSFSIYPVALTSGVAIVQIAAGRAHSLAVGEDGRLFAWGCNRHGQLAFPSDVTCQEAPKRIPTINEVIQVATGPDHCIALLDSGRVFVWGEQFDGKCLHQPLEVEDLVGIPIVRVAAGGRHCVAISASGAVYTWGHNDSGQLGVGDFLPRGRPVCVEQLNGMKVVEVSCGDQHTVLLTHSGRIFVFGSDYFGQCGCGKKVEKRPNPVVVDELMGSYATRICTGRCHTLALVQGSPYFFGMNSSGQLGNGTLNSVGRPRKMDELDHVEAIFAGWDQTFFLRAVHSENHVPGPNLPLKVPQFLNKEKVAELLNQSAAKKLQLIGLIESVFSSLSCLNGSFMWANERRFSVGDRNPGLDLDQVMDTFNLLAESSSSQQFSGLIVEMLDMSLFNGVNFSKLKSPESIRWVLILPWLSAFTNNVTPATIKTLHLPFSKTVFSLLDSHVQTLLNWWSKLPLRHFNRIVSCFLTAVRTIVVAKGGITECFYYLRLLEMLNKINQRFHIIPLESFYINELSELCNLKDDYCQWVVDQIQTKGQNSQRFWSNCPFLLNAQAKMELLRVEALLMQQMSVQNSRAIIFGTMVYHEMPILELIVRRESIVSDTMNRMNSLSTSDLQKPLKIKIVGEEADDAGGVKKEFFMIVMQKILQPEYGMFVEDPDSHLVWFSGFAPPICEHEQFHQLGRLCGLAVYNRVLVAFPFPLALYKTILEQPLTIDDLCELSPVEGKSLQSLLDYEGSDFEETFGLNFTIAFTTLGATEVVDLKPGGANIPVTLNNRAQYVDLYVQHRLALGKENEIKTQYGHFKRGFLDAIHSRILSFFQPRELMEMVVGSENYDWTEFRKIVKYKGEYNAEHPTILAFWEAFFQLTLEERKKFLQFVSGTTRLPVAGMSAFEMGIQPTSEKALPVAHTCFNLLDLPKIDDVEELLRRLRISIEHTQGFTLV